MANYSFHVLNIAVIIFNLLIVVTTINDNNAAILIVNSSNRLEYLLVPGTVCMMIVTKDETLDWKTLATTRSVRYTGLYQKLVFIFIMIWFFKIYRYTGE